jgi:vitamin B12 transporter
MTRPRQETPAALLETELETNEDRSGAARARDLRAEALLTALLMAGIAVPAVAEEPSLAGDGTEASEVAPEETPVTGPTSDLDDGILVVAKRFEDEAAHTTSAVTAYDRRDFERRQATHVDDVLRETPGVLVVRDGPKGQFSRLFVRGAASNQTMVVVDGVPQNDATTGGGYDFNDLGASAVERVEVLRGSYGVLYGSEAIGGVVSVRTRRGRGAPEGFVRVEGGSFDTHSEAAGVYGAEDGLDYAFTGSNFNTHGERHRESFRSTDGTSRIGYQFDDDFRLDWSGRYVNSRSQSPFDFASSGVLPEDGNIERRRETFSTGLTATWDVDPAVTLRGHTSLLDISSRFRNGNDGGVPGDTRAELKTDNDQTDSRWRVDGTWRVGETAGWAEPKDGGVAVDVTAGGEHLRQESDSRTKSAQFFGTGVDVTELDDTTRTKSWFGQADVRLPDAGPLVDALVSVGTRHDDHSEAGSEWSPFYGVKVDLDPTDTTLRASYGEGFRAPKPSELLDPFVGNLDLRSETSESKEFGAEQRLLDGALVVSGTWFELKTKDLIAYDADFVTPTRPFGALRNFGRARTRGTEWGIAWAVGHGFTFRGSYTRQDPEDQATGDDLPNRTRSFGTFGVSWEDGPLLVSVDGYYSGRLHDQGGEFTYPEPRERAVPGRVRVIDVTARYQATEQLSLFARIENVTDDDYVTTPSAPAGPPLGAYVGAQWDF